MLSLPFRFKNQKLQDRFLTITINSDNVSCLAFYVDGKDAKIIGVGKQYLEPGAVRSGVIIDSDIVENSLNEAIIQATASVEDDISDVIFGLGGNLLYGFVTTAKATRDKSHPIDKKELDQIYKKLTESAYIQAQNEVLETTGNSDLDMDVVTSATVYTKLDHTLTKDLLDREGTEVEVAYFTAFTPSYHVKAIQKLAKNLGLNIIAIGSEMYCLTQALKLAGKGPLDCTILNVDNDFTDVGIVFGGGIVYTKYLDIGAFHITREISKNMGLSFREAEKIKSTYSYGKLPTTETVPIQNSLTSILNIWTNGLAVLFSEFSGVKTFASEILLVGEAAELPDVLEVISKEPWTKSIPFRGVPTYYKVSLRDLPFIKDSTDTLGSLEYVTNAALSVIYLETKGLLND